MTIAYTGTFGAASNDSFSTGTHTYSGLTLGIGDIIVWTWNDNAVTQSITVAGISATRLGTSGGTHIELSVWLATGINSATGSVVVTSAGAFSLAVVAVCGGLLTGENSSTPTTTLATIGGADPQSIAGIIPASGAGIWCVTAECTTGNPATWTNVTRDSATEASIATGNSASIASAHTFTSGNVTGQVSGGGGGNGYGFATGAIGVVTFSPASSTGDVLSGPMPMIQMKRKSLGWTPPLIDHRRRQWRHNRSLLIPSNRLWTPKRKLAA